MASKVYYVGSPSSPSFLLEVDTKRKQVVVWTPDAHSRGLDMLERYVLGKEVLQMAYTDLLFTKKPVAYRSGGWYTPEVMVVGKQGAYLVGKKVGEWRKEKV